MRFLHTSDWHLGRTLHGSLLFEEQQAMVDAIVRLAAQRTVDAVIIAGDLFDRAIPSVEAVELWEQAVAQLRGTGARVIAISGNHDSARRVAVHNRLLELSGVAIRGSVERSDEPIMVTPSDGSEAVAVYAVPYLDPVIARGVFGEDAYEPADPRTPGEEEPADSATANGPPSSRRRRVTHHSITRAAMDRIRTDLAERGSPRSVVVSHTFVTGGMSSDSERDITLGNVENVPTDVFDDIDYVALGHLHGPQEFEGGRIAYSGSPLPYSFSEEHHIKSVRIIELSPDGKPDIEVVPLSVGMRLVTLEGTLEQLREDPAHTGAESAFVRVRLTDQYLPQQAMARLRERFPKAVEMRHTPAGTTDAELTQSELPASARLERPPTELAGMFFTEQEGRDPDEAELALIREALEEATRQGGER